MKLYIACFLYFVINTNGQTELDNSQLNHCLNKTDCTGCIQSAGCSWCFQPLFNDTNGDSLPRCNKDEKHDSSVLKCEESYIVRHKSEHTILLNDPIARGVGRLPAVSIQPQRMKAKLRVGEAIEFSVKVGEMEDYPLDLYFLMDLTKTMEDDKKVLEKEGQVLAEKMTNLTSKFRLGFGSFIDKTTLPFVQTSPKHEKVLLAEKCPQCDPAYGFKNHLILSENAQAFTNKVKDAKVATSPDLPEGGFDALMQVMVCNQDIGWKEQARKVVVFATDDIFHIAGDGKLGGIIRPNDGLCHLNAEGKYTYSLALDYPSISQLSSKAAEKSIVVIFSVTENHIEIYKEISERIKGSRTIKMSADSSNIADAVEEQYKDISKTVDITSNFSKDYFRVEYESKCLGDAFEETTSTSKCSDLKVGDIVEFDVKVELIKCPTNRKQVFKIQRTGISEELLIEVEALCDCPCLKPEAVEKNSPTCGGNGDLKCGICKCADTHFGKHCECDVFHENGTKIDPEKSCRINGSSVVCSNRGSCECGQCECNTRQDTTEKFSGTFCECDNFSCQRHGDLLCAGNGDCTCGSCVCNDGWTGNACECSSDTSQCRESDTDPLCGGTDQGECECGKCQCKGFYSGEFCDACVDESCPTDCEMLRHCVQCRLFGTGNLENANDCELECYKHNGLSKNEIADLIVPSDDPGSKEVKCMARDDTDSCSFPFLYSYDRKTEKYTIKAQRQKECPPEPPIFWIIVGIITFIVVIGVLTVFIWKLIDYLRMRNEYVQFKTEAKDVNWATNDNAIYRNPKTTFNNPLYGGMEEQYGFSNTNPLPDNEFLTRTRSFKSGERVDDEVDKY